MLIHQRTSASEKQLINDIIDYMFSKINGNYELGINKEELRKFIENYVKLFKIEFIINKNMTAEQNCTDRSNGERNQRLNLLKINQKKEL